MKKDINLYDKQAFLKMHAAGKLAADVLDYITVYVKSGVSTGYLNDLCHDYILKNNAIPAPLNYRGFPKSTCISVNHVVCHGIPGDKILDDGDILNIDVTVIPNAVDVNRFNPDIDGKIIRDKYALDDEPLALFVGRLVPHKGIGILIRSLTYTQRGKLLIVGDGPYKNWLVNLVKKLDLNDRVIFVGPVDDYWLPSYYSATDVVILPSTSRLEAFGIVGLEGMATAKPLILRDIPGVRDVISEKEGYIVEPLDPNAIAEALEKIWNAPEMAREMGLRGRNRVEQLFSWEKVSKDIESVFRKILSK